MPLIIPANSASASGFAVDNSCRFNKPSSDYLNRTPASSGSSTKSTLSLWFKKTDISESSAQDLYSIYLNGDNQLRLRLRNTGEITIYISIANIEVVDKRSTMLLRDPSAWYHVVLITDLTESTSEDKYKIYINNERITSFSPNTNTSATSYNYVVAGGNSWVMSLGSNGANNDNFFSGYIAEAVFIDGSALAPTSFGEADEDSGIWKPIDVSELTFGTNGFYLDFEDSAALGDDVSGNGNDFSIGNLTAIDQTTDTPTNNFCTLNPLDKGLSGCTVSEGNTHVVMTSGAYKDIKSTIGMSAGKWYWETKLVANPSEGALVGITQMSVDGSNHTAVDAGRIIYQTNGNVYRNVLGLSAVTGVGTYTDGDIISTALDMTNGTVKFYKNGSLVHTETNSTFQSDTWSFYVAGNDATWSANFGNPTFTISSGNTDGNGYGNFEYLPPSGFLSLCTANLSEILS